MKFTVTMVVDETTVAASIEPVEGGDLLTVYVDGAEVALDDDHASALFDAMRWLEEVVAFMQWVHVERPEAAGPPSGQ